ncbi:GNAT family N-acetyltransferase [Cloacibacillus evryensis]|uniref:GNAT family N-acetyltransferase n=1 Tax=Cloacibacillus evryensis TaxID=508460 RepID=UPI00241F0C80|nr:GNAT family N-acetyltransferase [Cloacibacillus evryensis]
MIETERLIMREITEADFEAASRILGDAGVMYAWEHGFSEEEVRRWIGECIRRYKDDGFSYLAAVEKTSGEIIGFIGPLVETIEGCRHFGVAYILMKERWGMGYATEGARASLACAFERLGAERVIAVIRPENSASRGVAKRLGMEIEGRFIRHYRGKEMPHLIYAISKEKWKAALEIAPPSAGSV